MGLLTMATCKAMAARRIVAVDVLKERLEFARQYAATDIWMPVARETDEAMLAFAKRNASEMCTSLGLNCSGEDNHGVDLIIDCAGFEVSGSGWND